MLLLLQLIYCYRLFTGALGCVQKSVEKTKSLHELCFTNQLMWVMGQMLSCLFSASKYIRQAIYTQLVNVGGPYSIVLSWTMTR